MEKKFNTSFVGILKNLLKTYLLINFISNLIGFHEIYFLMLKTTCMKQIKKKNLITNVSINFVFCLLHFF